MMVHIEYIDNDIQNGIKYDFKAIKKELKRLKIIPRDVYSPLGLPLNNNMWFTIMSERSRGKTTNIILLGLVMYKMYGTTIEYIRQTKQEIRPSVTESLFSTIIEHDYINVIFPRFNCVVYKWAKWYLAKKDENGEIVDVDDKHFMSMLSIDQAQTYKSGYNAPRGDLVIYDEFLSKKFYQPSFVDFCDLVKTIVRDRNNIMIFCLSNMIDQSADFFEELEVDEIILTMNEGDKELTTTEKGTNVYIEIIPSNEDILTPRRLFQNKTLFGFKNPKMVGITGGSWVVDNYPHIERGKNIHDLVTGTGLYIEYKNSFYRLRPVQDEDGQIYVYVTKASRVYDDSLILSLDPNYDPRYYVGIGREVFIFNKVMELYHQNRFKYATNSVGHNIEKYLYLATRKAL